MSDVVFLDDDLELFVLSRIFVDIPFEYGVMGKPLGKHYEATKDFIQWSGFEPSEWVRTFLQMGKIWANNLQD